VSRVLRALLALVLAAVVVWALFTFVFPAVDRILIPQPVTVGGLLDAVRAWL
jgi:type IV secretory pathway TrbL component